MRLQYEFDGSAGTVDVTDTSEGNARKPVVVLLHGNGGDENHMVNPAVSPGQNYDHTAPLPPDRNIGWREYPGVGVWSFELDSFKGVTGWGPFLNSHGYRTVAYSQVDPTGLLDRPVRELRLVMQVLAKHFPDPSTQFVIIAHSRGGLLIRKFVKDFPADANRIGKIITLHSPHLGSNLAGVANVLNQAIADLENTFGSVITAALGWLKAMVGSPSYQELASGSGFLTTLAANESALPGVEYYSFGGSQVTLTRLRSWVYTAGSAIPQWHWPPFHHRITVTEIPVVSPVLDSLPNLEAEITGGEGDMLVADRRAHMSFSVRRTNSLNHAEALWDPGLQLQVLRILDGELGIWG